MVEKTLAGSRNLRHSSGRIKLLSLFLRSSSALADAAPSGGTCIFALLNRYNTVFSGCLAVHSEFFAVAWSRTTYMRCNAFFAIGGAALKAPAMLLLLIAAAGAQNATAQTVRVDVTPARAIPFD